MFDILKTAQGCRSWRNLNIGRVPELWLIEAFDPTNEFGDPLALPLSGEQFEQVEGTETLETTQDVEQRSIEDVITDGVFGLVDPPRWIVLAHAGQLVLIERTSGHNGDSCVLISRAFSAELIP